MIFSPDRHEALAGKPWDAAVARQTIVRIAGGAEADYIPGSGWPVHPLDDPKPKPIDGLYIGNCGIIWALEYLKARSAIEPAGLYRELLDTMKGEPQEPGSYLFGETPILLLRHGLKADRTVSDQLARRVEATMDHPARELMWGAPGTMLAALFMHRRTVDPRWGDLFRRTAGMLEGQLQHSADLKCDYWTQDLYGRRSTYIDAVHGFAGTAAVLILGRDLLGQADWLRWQKRIADTVTATAEWDGGRVNWRSQLTTPAGGAKLVQYCHGAPGFVICLADSPDPSLDDLLRAAGETTWEAGPLRKGSNLCHGTGGNGYAFLKLYWRFGDEKWLERARAFAMHGIAQTQRAYEEHGHWRNGLWTGDLGFAIYLLDCIEAKDRFPTLDVWDFVRA